MMMRILGALARGAGYLVVFFMLTVVFVALTFPDDSLREWVELKGGAASGGTLRIGELDVGTTLNSVELTDVALKLPPPKPSADMPLATEEKPKVRLLRAERILLETSLFGLALSDDKEVEFEADVQGGQVRGGRAVYSADGGVAVNIAEVAGVQLGTAGLMHALTGFDVRGVIGAKGIEVTKGTAIDDLSAEVDFDLSSARVVKPVIPTKQLGPIQLSDIALGDMRIKVMAGKSSALSLKKSKRRTADPTVIWLEDVGAAGGDIELQFAETSLITLRPDAPLSKATLDVHFAVHFTDAFLDKKVTSPDGEVSQPNKILRMAFKQDARLRTAVRDGVMGITCRGTFERPNCRPGPTKIRAFAKRKPRFTPSAEASEESEPEAEKGGKTDNAEKTAARPAGSRSPVTTKRDRPSPRGADGDSASDPASRVRAGLPTSRTGRETPSRPYPVNANTPNSRLNPPTIAPGARTPGDTAYDEDDEGDEGDEGDERERLGEGEREEGDEEDEEGEEGDDEEADDNEDEDEDEDDAQDDAQDDDEDDEDDEDDDEDEEKEEE